MGKRMKHLSRLLLALVVIGVSGGRALAADPLITGVAIYAITLDPGKPGQLADVSGTMEASLTFDCDAYTTDVVLSAKMVPPSGPELPMDLRSTTVERGDTFSFDIKGTLGAAEFGSAEGQATRSGDKLTVKLTAPAEATHEHVGRVLFPVELTVAAIDAALKGERFFETGVFDGSGKGDEIWNASVLIADAAKALDEEEALFAAGLGLEDLRRWKMTFSYFPPKRGDETPAFSAGLVVYENGFAQAATYDFGLFAMKMTLTEFKPIPPKPCG